jgi:hypothetical protein
MQKRHPMQTRHISIRPWAAGLALAAALLLVACAGLGGPPTVTLSERDLDALARRAFPVERRLLDVFDATVAPPRLRLVPERNRVAAQLDIGLRDRLFGGQWKGQLDFDAALRWEPNDQTVRLALVRVQDFKLVTTGALPRTAGEKLGAALAERVLEDFTLYRLPAERAQEMQRRGVVPGAVTVTSRGVEITFAPAASATR